MARITTRELAGAFRKIADRELPRAQKNGARRGLRAGRKLILAELPKRGVLRSIFGKKKSGLNVLVKVNQVRPRGDGFASSIELRGLAALQETGGHTKPHDIGPLRKKALRFNAGGVSHFSREPVHHPGSRVPAAPVGPRVIGPTAQRILEEISKDFAAFVAKALS
jgi:hypothetical protein